MPDFRKISRAAALAGLLVALPASIVGFLLAQTHLPAYATAFVVVIFLVSATGALHEDGLSDVVDGFFGAATKEHRLEIMKDSRIGAFGTLALILSIGLKVVLIATLLDRLPAWQAMLAVLSSAAIGRGLMIWQWAELPSARPEGLGARFGQPGSWCAFQGLGLTLLCLAPLALTLDLTNIILAIVLSAFLASRMGKLARQKIDGQTGDVLGAVEQISELGFLLGLCAI